MKYTRLILYVLLAVCTSAIAAQSAITITIEEVFADNAPKMSAIVQAKQNGIDIPLDETNVLLVEYYRTTVPSSVSSQGGGKYLVEWTTSMEEYPQYDISMPMISFRLIVAHNNEAGNAFSTYLNPGFASISVRNAVNNVVTKELSFKDEKRKQIRLVGVINASFTAPDPFLDSVTFTSPYFRYNWQGNEFDFHSRPPMKLLQGYSYLVDVYYEPPDNKAYRALMIFHYNNGMKKSLSLVGGDFGVAQNSLLQLLSPNGNEKLTPCEVFTIRWKGHSKDDPVKIEFSANGGDSWSFVANVMDSVYNWYVPNVPTDKALIRIRQEYTKSTETILRGDWSPQTKIAFNTNGSLALSASANGRVNEFDIYNQTDPIFSYFVKPDYYGNKDIQNLGLEYIKDNTEILYVYQENYYTSPIIAYFRKNESDPYKKVDMPDKFLPIKSFMDPRRRFIAFQPRFEPRAQLLNPETGDLISYINVRMPINTMTLSKTGDTCVVVEINGDISYFDVSNLNDIKRIKFFSIGSIPIIANMGISPRGNLLALSVVQTDNASTESYLLDVDRGEIVRTYRPAVGTAQAIDFSPSSGSLIIGSKYLDQIVLYDLTGSDASTVINGHHNQLYDMKLDPEGFAILSSSTGEDNLKHRSFSYPESDASNSTFNIISAKLDITNITLPDLIIGTENTFVFNTQACNNGEVPVLIYSTKMAIGSHSRLLSNPNADTLYPGECLEVAFAITPLDTGLLQDEIVFASCQIEYKLPITFRSIDRRISLSNPNGLDFGEVCVGERIVKEFEVFRNNDTLDLVVNFISIKDAYTSPFKIEHYPVDTIIPAGAVFKVLMSFSPKDLGALDGVLIINHSNQKNVVKLQKLIGKGIGTFLAVSPANLVFIEEIDTRTMNIKNTGATQLEINEINPTPEGHYEILTALPLIIPPGDSADIVIRRILKADRPVKLNITAKPCLSSGDIYIDNYSGGSVIEFANTLADPRGRGTIEVKFENSENFPYLGERFFEGEFSINSRFFLPDSISSKYGKASLLKNETIDGIRHVRFRIDGDFYEKSGVLCKIEGVAGLAESNSTPITWSNPLLLWGKSVSVLTKNGTFTLTGICDNRYILQNNTGLAIQSINPNPASEKTTVIVETNKDETVTIEILDYMGQRVFFTPPIQIKAGRNEIDLNLQYLSNGEYSILVKSSESSFLRKLIIVR